MSDSDLRIVDLGPDDDLFPAWCEAWAASARAERPDELPRPAQDHVVLGRSLVAPGGSRDGARIREYEAAHVARGRTVLSAGAVTGGRLVGFTDLQVPLAQPERAFQSGTLVLREHRGHRLGALMKTAVLRELAAGLPSVRRISTYNAETNTPMVAVNEALGFRPAGCLSSWSLRL